MVNRLKSVYAIRLKFVVITQYCVARAGGGIAEGINIMIIS